MRQELEATGTVGSARRTVSDAVVDYRSGRPPSSHDDWVFGLIEAGLGAARVTKLTVADADGFLRLAASGLDGRRPIGKAQLTRLGQALTAVLTNEQRLGHVVRNVGALAELPEPGARTKERTALRVEELERLIAAGTGWVLTVVELCGRNGLRPAEARAVRWVDVDLEEGLLSVTGQNDRSNERAEVKRANNAARTVYLDERTVGHLAEVRRHQSGDRVRLASASGLAVATRRGTSPDRHMTARSLRKLCIAAGVPLVTPYELRHTAITHQADAGWSSFEIADWAGTSEQMISTRYRHRLRRVSRLRPGDAR
jgi:integrase/recombinase XerC